MGKDIGRNPGVGDFLKSCLKFSFSVNYKPISMMLSTAGSTEATKACYLPKQGITAQRGSAKPADVCSEHFFVPRFAWMKGGGCLSPRSSAPLPRYCATAALGSFQPEGILTSELVSQLLSQHTIAFFYI